MRDPNRIGEVIEALRAAWYKYPDMRLGQLVDNARYFNADGSMRDVSAPLFVYEDGAILDGINGMLRRED